MTSAKTTTATNIISPDFPSQNKQNKNPSKDPSLTRDLFIKLPNYIILHSNLLNQTILPLYLYSAISANICTNYVDTTLKLIIDNFISSDLYSKSYISGLYKDFAESLLYLSSSQDESNYSFSSNYLNSNNNDNKSYKVHFKSFSAPFKPILGYTVNNSNDFEDLSKIESLTKKPDTHIRYLFLDGSFGTSVNSSSNSGWTKVEIKEIVYILNLMNFGLNLTCSNFKESQEKNSKLNTIGLINLYYYLKYKILYFNKLGSNFYESQETICKNTGLSRNTLIKYSGQLAELGLIVMKKTKIIEGINDRKEKIVYGLVDLEL